MLTNQRHVISLLILFILTHVKTYFLIDDIIIFHSLTKDQIKHIVELQLEQLKSTARGQNITLTVDTSLIEHLADVGYQPEFGARELKRRIQSEVETKLAKEMLKGDIKEGSNIKISYSKKDGVKIDKTL